MIGPGRASHDVGKNTHNSLLRTAGPEAASFGRQPEVALIRVSEIPTPKDQGQPKDLLGEALGLGLDAFCANRPRLRASTQVKLTKAK